MELFKRTPTGLLPTGAIAVGAVLDVCRGLNVAFAATTRRINMGGEISGGDPHGLDAANRSSSFRGPLRYEVEMASTQLEAGTPFSIFVRITSPYDVRVTVVKIPAMLPVEFKDKDATPPGFFRRIKDIFMVELASPKEIVATGAEETSKNSSHQTRYANVSPRAIVLEPGNTAAIKVYDQDS
jgi:hypothetical protein